jgi:aromatic ring-opening dioxygenase catalytic subunit (LigB family)
MLPTLYFPHGGGPCFFMDWTWGPADSWDTLADWLRQLGTTLPRPRAVVVISAHWESEAVVEITSQAQPGLLYDYYGFPAHTYQLTYPAPGAPALAAEIAGLLNTAGIEARLNPTRDWDHGVFIPLKLIYPDADLPVVQISLLTSLDPGQHLKIGQALAPLRAQGGLLLGSGMSFHNLRVFGQDARAESEAFDQWLTSTLREDVMGLTQWAEAPHARFCHPREEHLLPLMVVAGAAAGETGQSVFSDTIMGARISAFQFGS